MVGIVLSALRATAATVPVLFAYGTALDPSATTPIEGAPSVQRAYQLERARPWSDRWPPYSIPRLLECRKS
jgi:hypothetical protein